MATVTERGATRPGLAGASSNGGEEHAYVNISSADLSTAIDLVPALAGHTSVVDRIWILPLAVEGVEIKMGTETYADREFLFDGKSNSMTLAATTIHELPGPLYSKTVGDAITILVTAGAVNINAYYHYEKSG